MNVPVTTSPVTAGRRQSAGMSEAVSHVSSEAIGDCAGELLIAWELAPGALLLLGVADRMLPERGVAQLERRQAEAGPFRSLSWQTRWRRGDLERPLITFAAALKLPPGAIGRVGLAPQAASGARLVLRGATGETVFTARLPRTLHAPDAFAAEAARLVGSEPALLARFLLDVLEQPATAARPDVLAMLTAFFGTVAQPDGCIEILAGTPEGGMFLQGWGRPLADGTEAVLLGKRIVRAPVSSAHFDRHDIAGPSTGGMLLLSAEPAAAFEIAAEVFLLGDALRRRRLVEQPRRLDAAETVAHLRALLPVLGGDAFAIGCLRSAIRPAFLGIDTINSEARPVRVAVDVAIMRSGAGAYLHGWMLDPGHLVTRVTLRGSGPNAPIGHGPAGRLDLHWTRIPRPDVSDAFRNTPGIPVAADAQLHGFAVHAPAFTLGVGELPYLEIDFSDGGVGFMPLQQPTETAVAARDRLLRTADLYKQSGMAVIEHQLAPFFRAQNLVANGHGAVSSFTVRAGSAVGWAVAVVVSLVGDAVPHAFLSQFLNDPLGANEGLVLVCGASCSETALAHLQAELRFRSLPALVLQLTGPVSPAAALDAAVAATQAEQLLLAGPQTHGAAPGWRAALLAAQGAIGNSEACLCPTLLYEDYSIRCTGVEAVECLPHPPWFVAHQPLAGLPAALAGDVPPRPVLAAGSLACCLIPRCAVLRVGGAARAHATAAGEALDFFFRLERAGIACLWISAAQVYALDDGEHSEIDRAGRLVDDWGLRAAWGARLAARLVIADNAAACTQGAPSCAY